MEAPPLERKLVAILAADVAGYSRLMGIDEEGTLSTLSAFRLVTDGLILQHGGRICGTAGDSILAAFGSALAAVQCAVDIQTELAHSNDALENDRRMQFRIGINVGDVTGTKHQERQGQSGCDNRVGNYGGPRNRRGGALRTREFVSRTAKAVSAAHERLLCNSVLIVAPTKRARLRFVPAKQTAAADHLRLNPLAITGNARRRFAPPNRKRTASSGLVRFKSQEGLCCACRRPRSPILNRMLRVSSDLLGIALDILHRSLGAGGPNGWAHMFPF
jgi:hypothetical protein